MRPQVFLGEVNSGISSTQVVVKELKASASVHEQMQFLEEAQPYRWVAPGTGAAGGGAGCRAGPGTHTPRQALCCPPPSPPPCLPAPSCPLWEAGGQPVGSCRALQHSNLLQCLAQCAEVTPYLLVMEFCPMVSPAPRPPACPARSPGREGGPSTPQRGLCRAGVPLPTCGPHISPKARLGWRGLPTTSQRQLPTASGPSACPGRCPGRSRQLPGLLAEPCPWGVPGELGLPGAGWCRQVRALPRHWSPALVLCWLSVGSCGLSAAHQRAPWSVPECGLPAPRAAGGSVLCLQGSHRASPGRAVAAGWVPVSRTLAGPAGPAWGWGWGGVCPGPRSPPAGDGAAPLGRGTSRAT